MTIVTKTQEKAAEKVILPVVVDGNQIPSSVPPPEGNSINGDDIDTESMISYRRRMIATVPIFLFFGALAIMLMGIMAGVTIYRVYDPSENSRHFRGMCDIPYDSQALLHRSNDMTLDEIRNLSPLIDMNFTLSDANFFREDFELDLTEEESYSAINVPDFRDGRRGRFMHDFKENQSVIIDDKSFRCFIMPLDHENVLPPKSFYDLIQKIKNGYYDIDTERISQKWRVITPAIKDLSVLSQKIGNECLGMKVYKLEKFVNSVTKRSADRLSDNAKFAEFGGKKIIEMDLVNMREVEYYEKNSSN